jgi:signal peptidase II
MAKYWRTLFIVALFVFFVDQAIKYGVLVKGWRFEGSFFSIVLTYNKGVAFSMFAFLGSYLKYIQLALIAFIVVYLGWQKSFLKNHSLPMGIILGAGCSNILDRFWHGGVVDYFFWHRWFEFAIFNLADALINLAVAILLLQTLTCKGLKSK